MEDNLYFFKMEDNLNFLGKWKTTSFFWKMENNLNMFKERRPQFFFEMEDNLNFLANGRRPHLIVSVSDFLFAYVFFHLQEHILHYFPCSSCFVKQWLAADYSTIV
jgi:hypothetical protein